MHFSQEKILKLFIYGGSNSLLKDGWTAALAEKMPQTTVVNRSIGAATSLMALFRLLTNTDEGPQPGDTVIWEYALNEAAHCARGYDAQIALRNVTRFVDECARRELKLVAAIFTPRAEELADARHPYYAQLHDLLQARGVVSFDVSQAWRAATGAAHMPKSLFSNANHYALDAGLTDLITEGVISALAGACVPRGQAVTGAGGLAVRLFDEGTLYQNSLISLPVAPNPSTMVLDLRARVIGVVALAHPQSNCAIRLELTRFGHCGQWVNISTTTSGKSDKTILKAFSLEAAVGTAWEVAPGDSLNIQSLAEPGPVYGENHVRRNLPRLDADPPSSFIGLVLELPA